MCPTAAAYAATIPDCAGEVAIARAHVMRVERNGVLVLNDGRAVLLEGIRLPEEDNRRDAALSLLRSLTANAPVTFTATAPKEDRYDRIRAQGFSGRAWLQQVLLEKGLARVAIAPDRNECAPDLYDAEARARGRHAGLWATSANEPRSAETMRARRRDETASAARPAESSAAPRRDEPDVSAGSQAPSPPPPVSEGSFQLVEGWVTRVTAAGGRIFIDFGNNRRQNFSAIIQPEDRHAFQGFDLESLEAHRIRIRGIVQVYRGRPEIALSNPAQIEVLN